MYINFHNTVHTVKKVRLGYQPKYRPKSTFATPRIYGYISNLTERVLEKRGKLTEKYQMRGYALHPKI